MFDSLAFAPWAPPWLVGVVVLACAAVAALLLHAVAVRVVAPMAGRAGPFAAALIARTRGPARLGFVILACSLALGVAPFGEGAREAIARVLTLGFVVLVGWVAVHAVDIAGEIYLRRFGAGDPLAARKYLTQVRILQRAATTLVVVITIAAALMTFDAVRQYGVSLFASAGAAGLVVGLAARPLLSNLIAGVQLAITQPIRIGDTVTVEGETGGIEEITSTYVVVRLGDGRRLIVPLSTFIEKPFQNWTRDGAALLGSITIHVDHAAPVDRIREELRAIVEASPSWDGEVARLEVEDCREQTMALKAVVSARDAAASAELRAAVREKLVAFLRETMPEALPRAPQPFPPGMAAAAQPPAPERAGDPPDGAA